MIPSDDVLVRQAADLNDPQAFAELVRRHQQKILLLQRRLTGERAMAEDLTQETFIRAWEKLGTYQGTGSFAGWLASIGYNIFLADRRRHRHRRHDVSVDTLAMGEDSLAGRENDESHADLERLLSPLPREDQAILVLTYAYGMSNTEVSDVLGMKVGTVKARIHRAKVRIQERIEQAPPADRLQGGAQSAPPPFRPTPRVNPLTRLLSAALPGTLKGAYRP